MPDFTLGTAHGVIKIDYDGAGVTQAQQGLKATDSSIAKTSGNLQSLGRGATVMGGLLAAGFAFAINSAADLEQKLSNIRAVSGATEEQMAALEQQTLDYGKSSVFSATEIAGATEELVKAGVSVEDALNGATAATIALAAAGGVSLPEAAAIAANAMNAFELSAEDLAHVADQLAGAANQSAIDVSQIGQSLQQVSAVAHLAGLSLDDTTVAIAAMGNAGIKGSDAGTSLKTMLQNLQPATARQSEEFRRLGLITEDGTNKFFDQRGEVKSLADISGVLGEALAGMTSKQKLASLEVLFGTDAIRAAAVVAGTGAEGIRDLGDAMGEISAADVAATRMDNFRGTVEQLRGAVETFMITIGTPLLGALGAVASTLADLINFVTELPGPLRTLGTVIGLTAAALLLLAGAALLAAPRIQATNVALAAMAANGSLAAKSMLGLKSFLGGPWGIAIAAATIGIGLFATAQQKAKERTEAIRAAVDEVRQTLDQQTGAITANTRTWAANHLEQDGMLKAGQLLGLSLETLTSAALGNASAMETVNAALEANGSTTENVSVFNYKTSGSFEDEADAANSLRVGLFGLNSNLEAGKESQERLNEATGDTNTKIGEAIEGTEEYSNAIRDAADESDRMRQAAADAEEQLGNLDTALRSLFDVTFGVSEAQDALQTKINSVAEAVADAHQAVLDGVEGAEEYSRGLDGMGQAAIDNRADIRSMAEGLADVALKQIKAGETQEDVTTAYQNGRTALLDQLEALGFNREAVAELIDTQRGVEELIATYYTSPGLADSTAAADTYDQLTKGILPKVVTAFDAETEDAITKVNTFKRIADEAMADRTALFTVYLQIKQQQGEFLGGDLEGTGVTGLGGASVGSGTDALGGLSAGAWSAGTGTASTDFAGLGSARQMLAGLPPWQSQTGTDTATSKRTGQPIYLSIDASEYNTAPREASVDKVRAIAATARFGLAALKRDIVVVPSKASR